MQTYVERETIAAELLRAWRERVLIEAPSRMMPGFAKTDALAVAERLRELRVAAGDRPAGYKVGFTNPAVREPVASDQHGCTAGQFSTNTLHSQGARPMQKATAVRTVMAARFCGLVQDDSSAREPPT